MTDRPVAVDEHIRDELVAFVRVLRRAGATVPANAGTTAARALAEVGLADRARARAALRATLLTEERDFGAFDRLFDEFWRRLAAESDSRSSLDVNAPDGSLAPFDESAAEAVSSQDGDESGSDSESNLPVADSFISGGVDVGDADDVADEATPARYSPAGRASTVDGVATARERALSAAFDDLTRALSGLQGRRFQRGADSADVRRALRASVSTGGTVLAVPRRERRRTAVRARFVVDVSRSVLDSIDRGFLVEFLQRATGEWRDVRVFFFDEGLREETAAIDAPSATQAMQALEDAEAVWGGGTRIGESLAALRDRSPAAVDRRTVVFVVSDGLETGDVSTLEREVSWLARRARRLFWLNPLAAAETFEPTARGMAAALPFLDGLFAFASPADVAELARQLRTAGVGGRVGYEFDTRTADRRPDNRRTRGNL